MAINLHHQDPTDILQLAARALDSGLNAQAVEIIEQNYPFRPVTPVKRKYTYLEQTTLFYRDGFIDRYSGRRLVFPGALRLLSRLLGSPTFSYHPNWKMDSCHQAFWELFPTVDHLEPVARGGSNEFSNWVTTSQILNSAKSMWTIEELGWSLHPCGDLSEWDGLTDWFIRSINKNPRLLETDPAYLKGWLKAAQTVSQLASSGPAIES